MPIVALFFALILSTVAFSDPALAQGAATGGTRDTGSPTMVFPIRPRDGPAASTAVPNVPRAQPRIRSFRQNYRYYHRYR
jgi:hypothetical protein